MGKVILYYKKFNSIFLIIVFVFNLLCDLIWFKKNLNIIDSVGERLMYIDILGLLYKN